MTYLQIKTEITRYKSRKFWVSFAGIKITIKIRIFKMFMGKD